MIRTVRELFALNRGNLKVGTLYFLIFAVFSGITCFGGTPLEFEERAIYTYVLKQDGTPESYDEAMVVACLQGIINRDYPSVYVQSLANKRPAYWLEIMSKEGRWLQGRPVIKLNDVDGLYRLAKDKLKGAVIWDPAVPATFNVANTIAGVEDAVVLSPEFAKKYLGRWKLKVLKDLRGMFTGNETGSAKNDAYRWAIKEYLSKGLCSPKLVCLYEDPFTARAKGDIGYVVTRDWAIKNRSFVYDLSPWGDEWPKDDPKQSLGTDLDTYQVMLKAIMKQTAGKQMTEIAGFFAFSKYSNMPDNRSRHDPVPTEWETVYLISPYNCYQNTVASSCFNQSFHSQAPVAKLTQQRPVTTSTFKKNKTYVCILMADYDSATPLYEFMPNHWDDKRRGKTPFLWGINPNLVETYPDIITYLYKSATKNDYFGADASAAGYMNPNRIAREHMPLFVAHNKKFYRQLDMTLSPMVLDWDEPTAAVKDAFTKFSPDGFSTIVIDMHNNGGKHPKPHVWKGMPVTQLINSACNFTSVEQTAQDMSAAIPAKSGDSPFYFFRIVWTDPGKVIDSIEELKKKRPDLDIEVADPYSFYKMMKDFYADKQ